MGVVKDSPQKQRLTSVFFVAYGVFLVWAILWKFDLPHLGDGTLRVINLIPFHANTVPEIRFNVLIFVPLGFYVSALALTWSVVKRVLVVSVFSAVLETIQYVGAIGRTDITDLILNTVGGVLGMVVYAGLSQIFGARVGRVVVAVGAAITVAAVCLALAVAVVFRYLV